MKRSKEELKAKIVENVLKGIDSQLWLRDQLHEAKKDISNACHELANEGILKVPGRGKKTELVCTKEFATQYVNTHSETDNVAFIDGEGCADFKEIKKPAQIPSKDEYQSDPDIDYDHPFPVEVKPYKDDVISVTDMCGLLSSLGYQQIQGRSGFFSRRLVSNKYGLARWEIEDLIEQLLRDGWLQPVDVTGYVASKQCINFSKWYNHKLYLERKAHRESTAARTKICEENEQRNRMLLNAYSRDQQQHPAKYHRYNPHGTNFYVILPIGMKILKDRNLIDSNGNFVYRLVIDK